jgi:hypothetical protein
VTNCGHSNLYSKEILKQKNREPEEQKKVEFENPHDDIFRDGWSYYLFLEMYEKYVKGSNEKKVRISYVYRVLEKDGKCIYQNKSRFEKFVREHFIKSFSRIQPLPYHKENNDISGIEHTDKLSDIQSKFEKKYPRE